MKLLKRIKKSYHAFIEPNTISVTRVNKETGLEIVEEVYEGDSEFLGEGSHEEFEEQERADKGLDKWYKRILR